MAGRGRVAEPAHDARRRHPADREVHRRDDALPLDDVPAVDPAGEEAGVAPVEPAPIAVVETTTIETTIYIDASSIAR